MKLLLDENLSPRLIQTLSEYYPNSVHVRDVDLASADDEEIWTYAKQNKLTIVSKDADFHQRSFLFGAPPKVVWLQCGNCSTTDIEAILRKHKNDLEQFRYSFSAVSVTFPFSASPIHHPSGASILPCWSA